jgi:hypothetical protein
MCSRVTDWFARANRGFGWGDARHAMEPLADLHEKFERIHHAETASTEQSGV